MMRLLCEMDFWVPGRTDQISGIRPRMNEWVLKVIRQLIGTDYEYNGNVSPAMNT